MGQEKRSHATKIGPIVKQSGLSIDTLRFYVKQGLLKRALELRVVVLFARLSSGFRILLE
jgi:hypothetical protein